MSHFMCREIDELFVGTDCSYVEDNGISCRISSSVSNVFVDFYTVYHFFYLLIFVAIIVDKLYYFAEYLGVVIFLYLCKISFKCYFAAN